MQARYALTTTAIAFFLVTPVLAQQDMRADATQSTIDANAALLDYLPFDDTTDFDDAMRGLIAPLPSEPITGEGGAIIWDPMRYSFITPDAPAPDTVNPSLWRMSRLLNISGLFEVVPDGIYQVRNYDLSNMTIVEGESGITIIDPLVSTETARAALGLYYEHRGERPVVAVVYTHSHVDHYGGVRGVVDQADVDSGVVKIYAPDGFLEHAVAENIFAGNVMSRRASYMYGNVLPPDPTGQVGAGLGTTTSAGEVTLIAPTDIITETGQIEVIDGLTYEFLMAPGSEAPSEMLWYIQDYKAIEAAEDVNHTLHNTYSLRGAKIREPLPWSKYINEAMVMWGDEAEVIFGQHHWPTWGNEKVVALMESQRDLYRFINDRTLHLANQGYTMREIAEMVELPDSLATTWANRGYYGSLYHDIAATYVLYLGWFDGNPATLHELPPVEESVKYVEYMGGADAILDRAQADFDSGEYRWVAQAVHHVVFADPENQAARELEAAALEQLGYQAESGPWRNFYLSGAQELRNGVAELPTPNTASPDTVRAMTPGMFFDYLGIRLDSGLAGETSLALNVDLGGEGQYLLELSNGVLNNTADVQSDTADATLTLSRDTLNRIALGETSAADAASAGELTVDGDIEALSTLVSFLGTFEFWFNLVTP